MKDVAKDLEDRLALLRVRYEVAFYALSIHSPLEPIVESLESGLHDSLHSAVERVRALVDPAELESSKFWGTPLGVLLFAAGGHLGPSVSQAIASAVLHCSRQYVHELVVCGKLLSIAPPVGSTTARLVSTEGVRTLARKKIDRLVKQV